MIIMLESQYIFISLVSLFTVYVTVPKVCPLQVGCTLTVSSERTFYNTLKYIQYKLNIIHFSME